MRHHAIKFYVVASIILDYQNRLQLIVKKEAKHAKLLFLPT